MQSLGIGIDSDPEVEGTAVKMVPPPPSKVHSSQNNGTVCARGNEVTGVESDLGLARSGNESLKEGYGGNLLILIFASLPASPVAL